MTFVLIRDMSKECKCEHWQQCPVCMPHRFDKNGHLLPPEPTPLQAARIRIEELERDLLNLVANRKYSTRQSEEAMNPYQPGEDNQAPYEVGYKAGAASRDADVVSLTNQRDYEYVRAENAEQERDQLRAQINVLRGALSSAESALDESRDYPVTYDEVITALSSTPEQSLAAYRNKVLDECYNALQKVMVTDHSLRTYKRCLDATRAMKKQP